MKTLHTLFATLIAPLVLSASTNAGDSGASTRIQQAALRTSAGLEWIDGQLCAAGRDYKVSFEPGGFEFVCPLGSKAARSLPFTYRLNSVARGSSELFDSISVPSPERNGLRVIYQHPAGVQEFYDVREDGIEQSFRIEALPAGSGDLVLRGSVETDLEHPLPGRFPHGLDFRGGDRGGVRIGAVVCRDANGTESPCPIDWDGVQLIYTVPEAVLAAARFPLVVDPLIGSIVTVFSFLDNGDAHLSYNDLSDAYLVTFERQWAGNDSDIYAQRVGSNGTPLGALILLETSALTFATNPTVAYAYATNTWFVAWQQSSGLTGSISILGPFDIVGRPVSSLGAVGSLSVVSDNAANEVDVDSWSPRTTIVSSRVVLVWSEQGSGIRSAQLSVLLDSTVTVNSHAIVSNSANDSRPAVARGGTSRSIIAWQRSSAFNQMSDIYGRMIDVLGNPILNEFGIATEPLLNESDPDIDGNGEIFAVTFEAVPTSELTGNIHCQQISLSGAVPVALVQPAPAQVSANPAVQAVDPSIAFLGTKFAVTWSQQVSVLDFDVRLRMLDLKDCTVCDGIESVLAGGPTYSGRSEIAARFAALPNPSATTDDQAMVVWETSASSFSTFPLDGDIHVQAIEAIGAGGTVVNLGGGCGFAGAIGYVGTAAPGSPQISLTLTGADPAALIGFLNTSFGAAPFACGTCLWDPFTAYVSAKPISGGSATYSSAVACNPALLGATFRYQWTVALTSGSPCPLSANVSISDRLEVTYGE